MNTFLEKINVDASEIYKAVVLVGVKVIALVLILLIGFRIVKSVSKKLKKKKSFGLLEPTMKSFAISAIVIGLKLLVIIAAIVAAGVKLSAIVTIIGAAGLAIGLALQGSLSNLAAGVLIITNKPFILGDYIDTPDLSGTVTDIGLFYTRLRTADGKGVAVPNSVISSSVVTNYGTYSTRRIDFNIGVSYESDLDKVRKVLAQIIEEDARIFKDPEPIVSVSSHQDSAVGILLRFWVDSSNYWDVNYEMYEIIKRKFDQENIEIPYPRLMVIKPGGDQEQK